LHGALLVKQKRTTGEAARARRVEQDSRKAARYSGGRRLRPDGLTDREALFIEEYCKDLNATQAAGYARRSAHVTASRLRNHKLPDRIEERLAALKAKAQMTAEEVLEHMTAIARGNMGDFAESPPPAA
jgi:hypothetical protein